MTTLDRVWEPLDVAARRLGLGPREVLLLVRARRLVGRLVGRRWFVQMPPAFQRTERRSA